MKRCGIYSNSIIKPFFYAFFHRICIFISLSLCTMALRLLLIPSTLWEPSWVVQMCIFLRPLSCWRRCSRQYFPLSPKSRSVLCNTLITSLKRFIDCVHWCGWAKFSLLQQTVSSFTGTTTRTLTKEQLPLLRITGHLQSVPELLAPWGEHGLKKVTNMSVANSLLKEWKKSKLEWKYIYFKKPSSIMLKFTDGLSNYPVMKMFYILYIFSIMIAQISYTFSFRNFKSGWKEFQPSVDSCSLAVRGSLLLMKFM